MERKGKVKQAAAFSCKSQNPPSQRIRIDNVSKHYPNFEENCIYKLCLVKPFPAKQINFHIKLLLHHTPN
ncbi:unnamed protein product [Prunus brigantina]